MATMTQNIALSMLWHVCVLLLNS